LPLVRLERVKLDITIGDRMDSLEDEAYKLASLEAWGRAGF
jgi:hypothetical protein